MLLMTRSLRGLRGRSYATVLIDAGPGERVDVLPGRGVAA